MVKHFLFSALFATVILAASFGSAAAPAIGLSDPPEKLCRYIEFPEGLAAIRQSYGEIRPDSRLVAWFVPIFDQSGTKPAAVADLNVRRVNPYTEGAFAAVPVAYSHGSIIWIPIGGMVCIESRYQTW